MPKGSQQARKGRWRSVPQAHNAMKSHVHPWAYHIIHTTNQNMYHCWMGTVRVIQQKQSRGCVCSWRERGPLLGKALLITSPISVYIPVTLSPPHTWSPLPLLLSPSLLQIFYFLNPLALTLTLPPPRVGSRRRTDIYLAHTVTQESLKCMDSPHALPHRWLQGPLQRWENERSLLSMILSPELGRESIQITDQSETSTGSSVVSLS